ncbi:MAG: hypothetical protein IKQ87_02115 [Clostridia bacterium]|nr:hypothetical protein [Clostridia bacterium]
MTIISPEKRWRPGWTHPAVLTECAGCGARRWIDLDNLMRGRSKGCPRCSQPRRIPKWLDRRLTAAKQRCENPKDKGYRNYGARGIRFGFPSVTEAGQYMIREFGLPTRAMEIDRIDANGDYAPGNLRFADHRTNCVNQRRCVLTRYEPKYWPYAYTTVIRKLSDGMTRDEIIRDAETAVSEKRKGWHTIEERLAFMTYEMPEDIIVLPYRTSSSTTADTAATPAR